MDSVSWAFVSLLVIVMLSARINGSSMRDLLLFFRFIIIPFSMYYLVEVTINEQNWIRILKWCTLLAVVQLPVILFQKMAYRSLISSSAIFIAEEDFDFGTFFTADDPALAFFMFCMLVTTLFSKQVLKKHKLALLTILSFTILIANAKIMHFVLLIGWSIYLIRNFKLKTFMSLAVSVVFLIGLLHFSGLAANLEKNISDSISKMQFENITPEAEMRFLEGTYSREVAVIYYLTQPINWFGDGPSRYYDPTSREYVVANTGQVFTFYSEIGLVGLILSYLTLLLIAFHVGSLKLSSFLIWFALSVLTVTTSVMSDASIMLTFVMFLKINKYEDQLRSR
ncbi:MAG: hypothetical protein KDC99_18000 [Cyclobacteriaceae bacterium]|nr:hypothetical protein [Cyclobacteriaceae bacterium]